MNIKLLLFASYREALGSREMYVDVPAGTTVHELYRRLEQEHYSLAALRSYTTFAVNREVVGPETELQDGDEVALLQPVSGGARD